MKNIYICFNNCDDSSNKFLTIGKSYPSFNNELNKTICVIDDRGFLLFVTRRNFFYTLAEHRSNTLKSILNE